MEQARRIFQRAQTQRQLVFSSGMFDATSCPKQGHKLPAPHSLEHGGYFGLGPPLNAQVETVLTVVVALLSHLR